MKKLLIQKPKKRTDTITRTIRISGSAYDKISALSEQYKVSFNNIVNQLIEYGLENLEE